MMEWKQSTYNLTSFEYLNLIKNHHHTFCILSGEGRVFGLLAGLFVVIVGTLRHCFFFYLEKGRFGETIWRQFGIY